MSDTLPATESRPVSVPAESAPASAPAAGESTAKERPAPDPTRYGDWEKNGRCIDF